jgi:hypothetical protein
MVIIEVPVGKRIQLDDAVDDYDYFSIEFGRNRRGMRIDVNTEWQDGLYWQTDKDMKMLDDRLIWKEKDEEDDWNSESPADRPVDSGQRLRKDTIYRYKPTASVQPAANQRLAVTPLASLVKMF